MPAPIQLRAGLALALAAAPWLDARGQEEGGFPSLHGEIAVEIQNDATYRSSEGAAEVNDLYATIEPALELRLTPRLSLSTALVLEPVFDPDGQSRVFDDEGLFVEQLYVEYQTERWRIRAGKINPAFGIAWDRSPGIYGVDFAEDYEINERVGASGSALVGNDRIGHHWLTAELFFLDTSLLSDSAPKRRGLRHRSDGGPSNTGDPRSVGLTLASAEIPQLPRLGYQIGFVRQETADGGRDEYGYAFGMTWTLSPREGIDLDLLSEYVYRRGIDGERASCHDFTQSAALFWNRWNLALSYSLRDPHLRTGAGARDHLFQASIGFAFGPGLGFDVGWRRAREGGVTSDGIGALLRYAFEF